MRLHKNTLCVISFLLLFASSSFAQMQIGVKANLSSSNIYEVEKEFYSATSQVYNNLEFVKNHSTVSWGLSAYSEMGYLFFLSDVMYRAQTIDFELETYQNKTRASHSLTEKSILLHIPIAAGILYKDFKIGAGPVINLPISRNNAFVDQENVEYKDRKVETGFQFLIGYNFKNFHVDLKRELSFTTLADNYDVNGNPPNLRITPNKFSVSLSYFFNRKI